MAKPELGIKRTCQSCDTFFYDLKKDPITCPKCMAVYCEDALVHSHRGIDSNDDHKLIEKELDMSFEEDDFFLDAPADLLESLEDLEEGYDVTKQVISN